MNIKICILKKIIAIFSASVIFSSAFVPLSAVDKKKAAAGPANEKNEKKDANTTTNNANSAENNENIITNDELNRNIDFFYISNIKLNNEKILMSKKIIDDSNLLFKDSPDQKNFLNQKRKNDSCAIDLLVENWPTAKKKKFDIGCAGDDSKISNSDKLIKDCLEKNKNDIENILKIFCDVSQLRSAINSYLNSKKGSADCKKNYMLVSECLKKLTLTYETSTIFDTTKQIEASYIILLELKKIKGDENLRNDPNYNLINRSAYYSFYEYISKKLEHIFGSNLPKDERVDYVANIVSSILSNSKHLDNIFDYAYNNFEIFNMLNCSIVSYFENLFHKKLQSVQNKKDAICKQMDYICVLISQLKSALDDKEDFLPEVLSNSEELTIRLASFLQKNVTYLTEMITGCNSQKMISCRLQTPCHYGYYVYPLGSFNEDYNRYKSKSGNCKLELFKLLEEADKNNDCVSFNLKNCIIFDPLVDDYECKKDLKGDKFLELPPQKVDKFNKNSEPDLNEKKKILSSIHKSLEKVCSPLADKKYNDKILLNSTNFKGCLEEILVQINNMKKLYQ